MTKVKIKIEISDGSEETKILELTQEEAREIYKQLNEFFGNKNESIITYDPHNTQIINAHHTIQPFGTPLELDKGRWWISDNSGTGNPENMNYL